MSFKRQQQLTDLLTYSGAFVTVRQLSEYWDVSRKHVLKLIETGSLESNPARTEDLSSQGTGRVGLREPQQEPRRVWTWSIPRRAVHSRGLGHSTAFVTPGATPRGPLFTIATRDTE